MSYAAGRLDLPRLAIHFSNNPEVLAQMRTIDIGSAPK